MTAPDSNVHRKDAVLAHMDKMAGEIRQWTARNEYFHHSDRVFLRFLIPEGARILDVGCSTGDLLAALKPSHGVGIDLSERVVELARAAHPHLAFHVGDVELSPILAGLIADGPFDYILLSDTVGSLDDVQATLQNLHPLCHADTRIILVYYSHLWEPVLRMAEACGLKMPQLRRNCLPLDDIANLLDLAGFDVVKQEQRLLVPKRLFGLGAWINRYIAPLPGIRRLCLRHYTVARSSAHPPRRDLSASVIIPCRNERGNIAAAIERLPVFCEQLEVIFVEGHSNDGTLAEIERVIAGYHGPLKLNYAVQDGIGKGDAVRKGFAMARGDVLMILDADLTVAPESLPRFFEAISSGKGEFANGSRLVYPMESDAMRFLNFIGNAFFAYAFSWLLNQRITDTLCGTKAITRTHYKRIEAGRGYFGDFDPFGDFDLIFGASKLNLKFVEIPIRYTTRTYGETQIQRFRHGLRLLRMVAFAFRSLKAIG